MRLGAVLAITALCSFIAGICATPIASGAEMRAGAATKLDFFHACVDREAKAAVRRAFEKNGEVALYGYHNDLNAEVFSICKQRAIATSNRFDDPSYVSVTVDAQAKAAAVEKMRKEYEEERRQDALNAPRLKAEKAEEDDVGSTYYVCLDRHARLLSVNSNEPAEVIAQASFASCAEEKQAVFDIYQRHKKPFSLETMEAMDAVFKQHLLLEIIKARALRAAPPAPSPPKQTAPI